MSKSRKYVFDHTQGAMGLAMKVTPKRGKAILRHVVRLQNSKKFSAFSMVLEEITKAYFGSELVFALFNYGRMIQDHLRQREMEEAVKRAMAGQLPEGISVQLHDKQSKKKVAGVSAKVHDRMFQ